MSAQLCWLVSWVHTLLDVVPLVNQQESKGKREGVGGRKKEGEEARVRFS